MMIVCEKCGITTPEFTVDLPREPDTLSCSTPPISREERRRRAGLTEGVRIAAVHSIATGHRAFLVEVLLAVSGDPQSAREGSWLPTR